MKVWSLFYGAAVCASLCSFGDQPRCSDPQIDANLVLLDRQLQDVISQVDSLAAEYISYFSRPRLTEMRGNLSNALQTLAKIKCRWGGSKQAYEEQYKNLHEQNVALDKQNKDLKDRQGVESYWMWIVLCIGVLALAAVTFLLVVGQRKPVNVVSREDGLPKCPRCGWKYTRGETKCRKCGTRF